MVLCELGGEFLWDYALHIRFGFSTVQHDSLLQRNAGFIGVFVGGSPDTAAS